MKRLVSTICGILFAVAACAQSPFVALVPGCCDQAIRMTAELTKVQYDLLAARTQLDTAKAVGDRLLEAKDSRILELQTTGSERIAELRNEKEQSDLRLNLVRSELENEVFRNRFLGWGRRSWARRLREKIK